MIDDDEWNEEPPRPSDFGLILTLAMLLGLLVACAGAVGMGVPWL